MIKLLFIGDIVGRPGRDFVRQRIRSIRNEYKIDIVVANAENSAGGAGVNKSIVNELTQAGVDAITLGDHVWDQRGFDDDIDTLSNVSRPANLSSMCPGRRALIVQHKDFRLGIITVLGRSFMKVSADCPFRAVDELIKELQNDVDAYFVEMHAETTAEKVAMGWYLDGRVALVAGTHTHIPTADARILPQGTAYITDVGMSGPYESVIGCDIDTILGRFLDGMPRRFKVATGDIRICGCIVSIDEATGLAHSFKPVSIS